MKYKTLFVKHCIFNASVIIIIFFIINLLIIFCILVHNSKDIFETHNILQVKVFDKMNLSISKKCENYQLINLG